MKSKVPYDLREMTNEIVAWADRVFPERTPEGTVAKLVEELEELSENPMDGWEIADVLILILDLCDMIGFDPAKLVHQKMRVNRSRKWDIVDGVFKHVEIDGDTERTESADREALDDSKHTQTTEPSGALVQRGDDIDGDLFKTGDVKCGCYPGSTCSRSGGDTDGRHALSVQKICRNPLYGNKRAVFSAGRNILPD